MMDTVQDLAKLVADQRAELDALRAENQQLRRMAKGANMEAEAELDSLRKAVASYENGITWQTTCLKCAETIDKSATIHLGVLEERDQLRAELAAVSGDVDRLLHHRTEDAAILGQRDAEIERLRARLVQTEATLTDFANPDHWVQNDDGEWVWYGTYPPFERPALDLLGSLGSSSPEAPPSEKPHINPDCGRCQIAGCTEHAVQCIATDRHTRDRHLRGKPYGSPEAPPVAAGEGQ